MRLPSQIFNTTLLFLISCAALQGQNVCTVQLDGWRMRAPLDVPEGQTTLNLCGLTPGNVYTVIANGAAYGQKSAFELKPGSEWKNPAAADAAPIYNRKHTLRFTAPAACVSLRLDAHDSQALTSIPMSLSVKCESCPEGGLWVKKFAEKAEAAKLTVVSGVAAKTLVSDVLIGGDCFETNNITASGNANSRGTFNNGATNIGISAGIVLSTGHVNSLPGPNDENDSGTGEFGASSPDDPDLETLNSGNQFDVSKIEFDFTPTASAVKFDFIFGSEEYCEYVNSQYNDVFGFFISGPGIAGKKNLAVIPSTNTPVAVNNVNHLTNSNYYVNNNDYLNLFNPTCFTMPVAAESECQLDGWTKQFTAVANVIPCSTYHIKLIIADIADAVWSSAVFLRANSFNAGVQASIQPMYAPGAPNAYEGCNNALRISRQSNSVNEALTVTYKVAASSTAIPGVDYAPLSGSATIPVGATEVLVPITVFEDQLPEGPEKIMLLVDNACSCTQSEVEFIIDDKPALTTALPGQAVCPERAVTLAPASGGGLAPYTYQWSTGATSPTLTVAPNAATVYSVKITDACGATVEASALVDVLPLSTRSDTVTFCAGESVQINSITYTQNGTVLDTLPGLGSQCDTVVTYTLVQRPRPGVAQSVDLCPGQSINIGGVVYNGAGTVTDTLPGFYGDCDTVVTYTLKQLPYPARSQTISFCPGESVSIGGVPYFNAGTVLDTLPGFGGGCDTVVTYTLQLLPKPARSQTITFCPGESVTIDGVAYQQPGTVTGSLPATVGCDTVVTYILQYSTPAPSNVTLACPSDLILNVESATVVNYTLPVGGSDCPCPGTTFELKEGLAPGSLFPLGNTKVCYLTADSCGNSNTCCFEVRLLESKPCDVKELGCVKFELMGITQDGAQNTTYRIRVTNNCSGALQYAAFQLPEGVIAVKPSDNSTYTGPDGQSYTVRNPNYPPFYSIRFASKGKAISAGQSDVFIYTLPPRSMPNFIHATARIVGQPYLEVYLNTFFCPIGITPEAGPRTDAESALLGQKLHLFPNPASDRLFAHLPGRQGEMLDIHLFDAHGRQLHQLRLMADVNAQEIPLPENLADGLYLLSVETERGVRQVERFFLKR